MREVFQANEVEQVRGAGKSFLPWHTFDLETEGDVVQNRAPRKEREALEHKANVIASVLVGDPVQLHVTSSRRFQRGNDSQEGGLSAPRRPHDAEELAGIDGKADVAYGPNIAAIGCKFLGYVLDDEFGGYHRVHPAAAPFAAFEGIVLTPFYCC